ncbi:hypothetical protein [Pseudomonas fluorescens]|uniref:hypothetical protein n=1 Tax=Pseudomonas fluorescens TaxID=294 RepID=UPI001CD769D8|nr:hypothetical protein [Pseudomonas fluorescens]
MQTCTTEDSTGCIHGWHGSSEPVGLQVRSEVSIIAGLTMTTLPSGNAIDWQIWSDDYSRVRSSRSRSLPMNSRRLCRWVLPRMQSTGATLAPCRTQRGAGRQIGTGMIEVGEAEAGRLKIKPRKDSGA